MRMRETWLALSRSKRTVMFSSASAPIALPPRETVYDGLIVMKVGARQTLDTENVWFVVSEECMSVDA